MREKFVLMLCENDKKHNLGVYLQYYGSIIAVLGGITAIIGQYVRADSMHERVYFGDEKLKEIFLHFNDPEE